MQTYAGERLRQRGAVLVAALLLVASAGPFTAAAVRHGPDACTLLPQAVMARLYPGSAQLHAVTPTWTPPGTTLCGGLYGDIRVSVSSREARALFESARAGESSTVDWFVAPGTFSQPRADGPRPGWSPQPLPGLGYKAFAAGSAVYVLAHGYFVQVFGLQLDPGGPREPGGPTPGRVDPAGFALLVASQLPPRVTWWNPLSWLDAALP